MRHPRDMKSVLTRLSQRADAIARSELERTLSSVGEGLTEAQRGRLETMARTIINELLHEPTTRLRAAESEHEGSLLAGTLAELFGLRQCESG
ncbi:MAG TPA: hypothetical protein VLQ93_19860 [Myxococcaceae bacterium]|nr:hypothetical protein [Myxococcaceae bacterium]